MKISLSLAARKKEFSILKINDLADTISQHIVYCYLYSTHDSFNHWLGEISASLEKVYRYNRLKGGKFIKPVDLHEHLYNSVLEQNDELLELCIFAEDHLRPLKSDFDYEQHIDKLHNEILKLYLAIENLIVERKFRRSVCETLLAHHITIFKL
jgi:hypothetical protein